MDTTLGPGADGALRSTVIPGARGRVFKPTDRGYDEARRVDNPAIDRRPALIARPTDATDVAAVLAYARRFGMRIAVRAGGHSVAGHSTGDGVCVIDLSTMRAIEVDPSSGTAWVEAGVLANEFTSAAFSHGLAVSFGDTGSVGVAGITLGGGIGWLVRKHGLTVDSLIAAELVTADGRQLTASEEENADLFWALRGGGGNFGVVTRLRYRLHPIGDVLFGDIALPATRRVLRRLVPTLLAAPDYLTAMASIMPASLDPSIPAEFSDGLILYLQVVCAGRPADGQQPLAPLRALGPVISDAVRTVPYPAVYAAATADPTAEPEGWTCQSLFVEDLDDAIIDIIEHRLVHPSSPLALVHLRVLGGAVGRVAADATAFGWRDRAALLWLITPFTDLANAAEHDAWTADFRSDLRPHGSGAYVNFMGAGPADAVREAYLPATWARLRAVKRRYDPDNVFRSNHNIPPA